MEPFRFGVAGLLVVTFACSACGGADPARSASADEDERGSVGVPPTAGEYCARLGFTVVDSNCQFGDGTSCDQWAFYRGSCGQPHSYCAKNGGTISTRTKDMGGWTAVYGECALAGKVCEEGSFMKTGTCE